MKIIGVMIIILAGLGACTSNSSKEPEEKGILTSAEDAEVSSLVNLATETDIQILLCQNWENKEDAEDAAVLGGGGSLEMPYRGLSFFSDGLFTENPRDQIRFGKWKLNGESKLIDLEFTNGSRTQYKIGAIGSMQMVLMNMGDKKKTAYISDAKAQQTPGEDPFHPSNNQWRIRPKRSETDSAIKLRTKQAVLFYAKFLKDNAARGDDIISFTGLPTCFKWYSGGISVVNKDKLEDKWIDCFYNKDQAIQGQQLIDKIITKKYKWDKEEPNWIKQSADVMRQMYDTLR